MLNALGWAAWGISAFLAISWSYGLRTYARAGQPFQKTTAVQTLFFWAIAIGFLVSDLNKLHILWIGPVSFFLAMFIVLAGIPIITPLVMLGTHFFVSIVLLGVQRPRS